ncbi:MAG: choice-of-anchor X domain-containing protein [Ornithinimicrobium sp.]
MVATPLAIPHRPFAVEPVTEIMMPDGIFDASIFVQRITAQLKNTADRDLADVDIYLEGISDPAVVPTAYTHRFPRIPAGATVTVAWEANFQNAGPGKPIVSVVAREAGSELTRSLKRIYVSRTSYDEAAEKFICEVPEGRFEMTNIHAFGPNGTAWQPPPECEPDEEQVRINLGPFLPISFDAVFVPNPAYFGTHGELPFSDPWWKVLAVIVLIIAAVVGAVLAATSGGTTFVGAKGKFDETGTIDPAIECCEPDWKSVGKETGLDKGKVTGAGIAGVIATTALAVALSDDEDPWWRGQRATTPPNGSLTVGEEVSAKIDYVDPPNAGVEYRVETAWDYKRHTDSGDVLLHQVAEARSNTHLAETIMVDAPSPHHAFAKPLTITLEVTRAGGAPYAGPDLFAFALLISPDRDYSVVVPLADDGIGPDKAADDGAYTGEIHLEEIYPIIRRRNATFEGRWKILAFAQDVNLADEDDLPEIQAQTIGGHVVVSPITLNFDTSLPCPITAQKVVEVIT